MIRLPVLLVAVCVALALAGCGGGGGGGGGGTNDPIPTGAPIQLTGVATFDRVPTTAGAGLNYAATVVRPIRDAVVQVRSAGGTHVLYTATTDGSGAFTIQAPSNASVRLVVFAAMGATTAVVDNTAGEAVYATYITVTTAAVNMAGQNVHAASGWTGSGYGATRAAAPFAILDTAHDVLAMIEGADPSVVMPDLVIGWSPNNTSTPAGGTIGTSHYSPSSNRILVLGQANWDTDEYDDHVIAHEIGHWFETNFSRSDSLGGSHGGGDILDEPIAFGEGFGNAFSGMATKNRYYRDTMGTQQGNTALELDLEDDAILDGRTVHDVEGNGDPRELDGAWSEVSVQEILYDLFDGVAGTTDSDADGVALGFTPIYDAMVGAQRTTPGFTSIYSFLTHVKATSGMTTEINALAAAENIGFDGATSGHFDQFDSTVAGLRRHKVVPNNGTVVSIDIDGIPLTTYAKYGDIDAYGSAIGSGNKLLNWMFFVATVSPSTTYRIKATPPNLTDGDVVIRMAGGISPSIADVYAGGAERLDFVATGSQVVFAVGSFASSSYPSGETPFTIQLGTPGVVGKPSVPAPAAKTTDSEAEAVAPQSNG